MASERLESEVKVVVEESKSSQNKRLKDNNSSIRKNAEDILRITNETEKGSYNILRNLKDAFSNSRAFAWGKIIKDSINGMIKVAEAQTEYIENLNLMQVAFDDTAKQAENFVHTLGNEIGFDESSLTRQLGIFRQISDAMGYTSDVADLLSTNLSKLQLDISSLYNTDIERAGKALESAITGQVRSIRSLTGADITLATLQQDAYRLGIQKTTSEMTRAEKTILIYLSLERQLANANGDLSRTINSVANQTKIFRDQIAVAGRQIGAVFIPILRTLLPILNGILMAFNTLFGAFLGFIGIDASAMASEFGVASSGIDLIGDSLDGVSGAAEKAKKSLRGFDKLNNITTPTPTTSSGGGGGGAGGGIGNIDNALLEALKEYNLHLDEMKNKATKIRDLILEWLGFSKNINGEWQWSGTTLLKNLWNWWSKLNLLGKAFVAIGVGKVLLSILNAGSKLITFIKGAGIKAIKTWNTLWEMGNKTLAGSIDAFFKTRTAAERTALAVAGIVSAISGFGMIVASIQDIKKNGMDLNNVLQLIIGTLGLVGGAILTVSSIMGGFSLSTAAITGGISLVVGALAGLITWFNTAKKSTQDLYADLNADIWSQTAILTHTRDMAAELEGYIDANGRVQESDEQRVSYILNQLNDAYGTEYKLIDGLIYNNGELVDSYGEIMETVDAYIAKMKAQYTIEKYKDVLNEALEKQQEKQILINQAHDDYNKLLDEEYKRWIKNGGTIEEWNEKKKTWDENQSKRLDEIEKKYSKYEKTITTFDELQRAMYNNNISEIDRLTTKIIGSQAEVSKKAQNEVKDVYNRAYAEIRGALYGKNYDLGKQAADGINSGLNDNLKKNYEINIKARTGIPDITQRAGGGFVNSGEFFVARENGLTEYVGSFGNRTAVANNDQIVEGITIGVSKALAASGGNNNVVIEAKGDTSGLLNFITFEQQKRDRRYGL